jgi:diaminohydroxyphosphoribosylaminopyrimidine deaminase/5-amino-6-(5-phosphoribosylamino)uracil reductase
MAGNQTEGATLYVTLEPCVHYGKTPPCVEQIIRAGIKQVHVAMQDPNPLVSGRGIELLRAAKIDVLVGLFEKEAKQLNEDWAKYITTGLPFITVKTAMTLDGKIASRTGKSKWITAEVSRENVHRLRHEHDAVMVGAGTIIADNSSLTTRGIEAGKNPLRIVIDANLDIPLTAAVVTDGVAKTWIFTNQDTSTEKAQALKGLGIEVHSIQANRLIDVFKLLGEREITSVLVEGGSELIGSLFDQKLIDKYITFIAPKLIGGRDAITSIGGMGLAEISEAVILTEMKFDKVGEDICISGYPKW